MTTSSGLCGWNNSNLRRPDHSAIQCIAVLQISRESHKQHSTQICCFWAVGLYKSSSSLLLHSAQKSRLSCLAWRSHLHDGHDCPRLPVGIRGLEQRAVHIRVKLVPKGRVLLHATLPEGLKQQQK